MNSETTVGYKEFINVIKRGKWIILLITLLLTLTAISISYYSMKSSKATYQTKTSIIIGKKQDIVDAKSLIGTFEKIANSSTIGKNASAALNGSMSALEIQSSYEITAADDAPILTITATGDTQKESMAIVNAVYSSFSKEVVRIYPTEIVKIMENSVQNDTTTSKFKVSNVVLAFLLGLFLSIFIVTFVGFFDEKIRTKDDVEKYLDLDVIGNLPKTKYEENPNLDSIDAKAFYELKANIQFLCPEKESKVIMISSAEKNEGRSTTAAYLSLVLAESGKKTVLVDCDQKNSSLHNMFNLSNDKGLVNYLSGDIKFEAAVRATEQKKLSIVTCGAKSLNYAELFVSEKFKEFLISLKEDFDYIIIDTPQLTQGADAKAISKNADGCVLVVKYGQTERENAIKAKEILNKAGANIIGVCLNKTNK